MSLLRPLLSLALAANVLFAGVVGSLHFHGPGETCCHDGQPPQPEKAHAHCCGHQHHAHCRTELETAGAESQPVPPADPHDEDGCSLCKLIATAWLPTTIAAAVEFPAAVDVRSCEMPARADASPLSLPLPRGPPAPLA